MGRGRWGFSQTVGNLTQHEMCVDVVRRYRFFFLAGRFLFDLKRNKRKEKRTLFDLLSFPEFVGA
jgi:hypothetical protein